jgi:hypothetical protein
VSVVIFVNIVIWWNGLGSWLEIVPNRPDVVDDDLVE